MKILLYILLSLFLLNGCDPLKKSDPRSFMEICVKPDENQRKMLQKFTRDYLGKYDDQRIFYPTHHFCSQLHQSLKNKKRINYSKFTTTGLSLLKDLTQLEELDIGIDDEHTEIDLSILSELTNLKKMRIGNSPMDFKIVENLNQLESLDVSSRQFKNLNYISKLKNLKELHMVSLFGLKVESLQFLEGAKNLESFWQHSFH